ncbi:hypothetical protein AU255_04800 [Methyloprofundus sedimenti]|uniref:Uncharacterized protein n=1 Tax=Methyloprofundus sedimenti TaxID=1420851 RepID=A0A1V8M6Q1_9GAMM|nr:hypothetical protein [Methyloprofundus sedimenti]OQK17215.1 hypothetical protein AU255_04800 [Methyloprofundus sedimenti]
MKNNYFISVIAAISMFAVMSAAQAQSIDQGCELDGVGYYLIPNHGHDLAVIIGDKPDGAKYKKVWARKVEFCGLKYHKKFTFSFPGSDHFVTLVKLLAVDEEYLNVTGAACRAEVYLNVSPSGRSYIPRHSDRPVAYCSMITHGVVPLPFHPNSFAADDAAAEDSFATAVRELEAKGYELVVEDEEE